MFRALLLVCFILSLTAGETAPTVLLADDFSQAINANRNLIRGDWKITDGQASCAFDEALAKNNNDHGPGVGYKIAYTDATVTWEFKPGSYSAFNTVINDEKGHVFRIKWFPDKDNVVLAFDDAHKSKILSKDIPLAVKDQWYTVSITFRDDTATIVCNGSEPLVVKDPAYKKKKEGALLTFSGGTFAVRKFMITTP